MTTIAYDGKSIAIDSRATSDNCILDDNFDKWIDKDGIRFFWCGEQAEAFRMIDAYQNGIDIDYEINCDLLALFDDNGVFHIYRNSENKINKTDLSQLKCIAFGSGSKWAIAAMDFGKNAAEAVDYAITKDMKSGGKVKVFTL